MTGSPVQRKRQAGKVKMKSIKQILCLNYVWTGTEMWRQWGEELLGILVTFLIAWTEYLTLNVKGGDIYLAHSM